MYMPSETDNDGKSLMCVSSDTGTDAAESPVHPTTAEAEAPKRGRPLKRRNFNFSTRNSPTNEAQQRGCSNAHDHQAEQQSQQQMAVRQSGRTRVQRKVYDADTGTSIDPVK